MDHRRSFFDSNASGWDERIDQDGLIKSISLVVESFGLARGERILDVGTGTGVLLPLIGHAVGPGGMVVGIDFSLNMLHKAMRHLEEASPALVNAGVAAIPFKGGSFDKVTCFSAFPHFPDKERALIEMVRVLRKGGWAFIAHLHSVEEIARLHGLVGGAVRHDRLPDPETMLSIMQNAGLGAIDITNQPGKFLALGQKS